MSRTLAALAALTALTLVILLAPAASSAPREPLTLTFLGNQGFLLESGGRKVLVDALVATSHRQYVWQGSELREDLERARPPFDGVDLVLASHFHGDHFDPGAVGRHLAANPEARFVSTPDAVARLEDEFAGYREIASRVDAVYPAPGGVRRLPELGLEVYRLHHGRDRREIQNLGLVIDVGGWRVGAVGDTEASAAEFRASAFPAELDVGLFAAWLFDPEQWPGVTGGAVRARVWVPTHRASGENAADFAPGGALADWVEWFQGRFPERAIFTRILQRRELAPAPEELDVGTAFRLSPCCEPVPRLATPCQLE